MALLSDFHLTVSHATAYLDFAQFKERTIHVRLALDVVCHCETSEPLVLNGINFVNVHVEGATRFSYDGFFVRAWVDNWRAGQHHRIFVSYSVVRPVCGVLFLEHSDGHTSIGCDFEACNARYMFACQDAPSFAATWELHVRAAAALTRLATGQLVGEVPNSDGSVTSIWRQEVPIPSYLVSFAVGHFRRVDENLFGPMDLDPASIRRTFSATKNILSWLEGRFGPLPCAKFYQVLIEISTAMENESLVLFPPSTYALRSDAEREEHGWDTDRVVCHEAVHSYFGNMVHIGSWAHLWVKEGFATMLPQVWAYERVSEEMGDYIYMRMHDLHGRHGGRDPPCYQPHKHADEVYTTDTYSGSCMRLWNLRGIVGEKSFWEGVSLFLSTHAGERAADSHDLMRCLERTSFQSLVWWFDQWMFKRGVPLLSMEVDKDTLTLTVRDAARPWRFDMDVCGGVMVHFTPKQKSISVPLTTDALDFNVTQRVPFKLDKKNSRVPRALLLSSLASPSVSIATKMLLFGLLEPADALSVYRLEPKWSVRGAFLTVDQKGVTDYAVVHERNAIVRAQAVKLCTNSDLLVEHFDSMRSQRTQSNALRNITSIPFLIKYARKGEENAVTALGRLKAVKELDALPRDLPGLDTAYSLCGQREQLLALLRERLPERGVSLALAQALVRVGAFAELRPLYPKYISESVYLLDVEDSGAETKAAPRSVSSDTKGLDATSLVFGAMVAAVAMVGLFSKNK